jgi:hypothetical protein
MRLKAHMIGLTTPEGTAMRCSIEVVILPVSDVDRALAFHAERAGFALDIDYAPSDEFRVVQPTPPGSTRRIYAVVDDLQHVRSELLDRGVDVGEIRHKASIAEWRGDWEPGLDPARTDYASFANFQDPDGNQWVLQERGFRG